MTMMIKWVGIITGALMVLIILILIVVPFFFDIQKYKPRIEQEITKATGRPFIIGGDLKLSLFPWAGLAFSDLHLGNPDGFAEKDLLSIKSFDVKVKFLPLLSKDIQVKRFVIVGLKITLEKTKDAKANWQGMGKKGSTGASVEEEKKAREGSQGAMGNLPIKGLTVAEFAVREGEVLYIDHASNTRKKVKDLNIELNDVSLEDPFKILISADIEGKPVSIEGEVGPLGKELGKGTMMVDLAVKAMNTLYMDIEGSVTDVASRPHFDLDINTEKFSPRDLMKGLLPDFSLKTKDPAVLTAMSTRMKIKGTTRNIEISDGTIELDQSKMTFSAIVRDFKKPDLAFKMNLDRLDVDRYLPLAEEKKAEGKPEKQTKTGYGPLRKMVLDGAINIGELDIKGSQIKDIQLRLKGQNGILNLDPFSLNTYEGNMTGVAVLDFRGDVPVTQAKLEVKEVQVRRLISDFMKKDILEGKATASINLSMSGDNAALIKKSLDGKGEIQFRDGAIVGIDLSGMVNNLKAAFGLAQPGESKDRTDFSEFIIPFEINDGVVNTQKTTLVSPVLRILAKGNADLSKETLDFRLEPTFVATLKGQGDTKERSGVTVPVLVTGSFTDPKFSPDLTGMLKKSIEKGVEKLIKGRTEGDAIKGLLKGILGK
jgi:AsmA protein